MYSFDTKIASTGYLVYRNSTWQNLKSGDKVKVEIETNKSSKSIDPNACTIKVKHKFFWHVVNCGRYANGNITPLLIFPKGRW